VDCVVFGVAADELQVLLIQRGKPPFEGQWAFPGGFVGEEEDLETAARRELEEETSLRNVFLEQLYTFGAPGRDPRGHVVTVAYYALVNLADHRLRAATDAREAAWFSLSEATRLAFDHDHILATALARLRGKVRYQPLGFELLPKKFTLSQLQRLYEIVLDTLLDKRNFRRKVLATGLLVELDELERTASRRPARLYRFDRRAYRQLERQGFLFEI
jgi:8-oxo-dGTP diphosphatase